MNIEFDNLELSISKNFIIFDIKDISYFEFQTAYIISDLLNDEENIKHIRFTDINNISFEVHKSHNILLVEKDNTIKEYTITSKNDITKGLLKGISKRIIKEDVIKNIIICIER